MHSINTHRHAKSYTLRILKSLQPNRFCPTNGGYPSVLGRHQTYPGRAARPPPRYRGGPGRVRPAAGGDKDTPPARRSPPPHSPAGRRASAAPLTAPPPAYSASAAAAAWADASASGWNRRRAREGALPSLPCPAPVLAAVRSPPSALDPRWPPRRRLCCAQRP